MSLAAAVGSTDPTSARTPEKGTYRAFAPSTAVTTRTPIPLGPHASVIDRRPVTNVIALREPAPDRSALDEGRRSPVTDA